jgi:cytochrome c-type biogenesis protein CcmF
MTAFLHSVMMQEKRGMLKRWNLMLIAGSFLLSIFGTFITRSGVIASVHSFTQSNVGYYFLVFLLLAAIFSFVLIWSRWPRLESEAELDSMVSREAAFLFNNLALVGIAFSVLWGTLFPIISELVRDTKITVGPPFFNRVNVPLGLLLLALTGIGPLIAWRKASAANLRRQFVLPVAAGIVTLVALLGSGARDGYAVVAIALGAFVTGAVVQEFWRGVRARMRMHAEAAPVALGRLVARNRRRYGGYLVHVAIVIYFVAFAGMAFKKETEATLKPGQSVELASPFGHQYRFMHEGVSQFKALNRFVSAATVRVFRDGEDIGLLTSEKRQHVDTFGRPTFEPSTEVGIRSDLREDLYLVYAGSVEGTEEAVYRVAINPLVWWVWAGGFVLTLGGLITMWPGGLAVRRVTERAAVREQAPPAELVGAGAS